VFDAQYDDKETFMLSCEIMLKGMRQDMINKLRNINIHTTDKIRFMRGYDRQNDKIVEYLQNLNHTTMNVEGIITSVSQFIIRSLYAGVVDVLSKSKYDELEFTQEQINMFTLTE
jgi:hypothetical protein